MTGKSRTVGLMTVGCKLNQYETEGVAERLEERGFVVVPFDTPADVYVVNTCTVTGRSDYRSRQMLRRAARRSKRWWSRRAATLNAIPTRSPQCPR